MSLETIIQNSVETIVQGAIQNPTPLWVYVLAVMGGLSLFTTLLQALFTGGTQLILVGAHVYTIIKKLTSKIKEQYNKKTRQ